MKIIKNPFKILSIQQSQPLGLQRCGFNLNLLWFYFILTSSSFLLMDPLLECFSLRKLLYRSLDKGHLQGNHFWFHSLVLFFPNTIYHCLSINPLYIFFKLQCLSPPFNSRLNYLIIVRILKWLNSYLVYYIY